MVTAEPRPAAVVTRTTWEQFPSLWRTLLDEVEGVVRTDAIGLSGHSVMLYRDDRPRVEVGVGVAGPFRGPRWRGASHLPGDLRQLAGRRGSTCTADGGSRAVAASGRSRGWPVARDESGGVERRTTVWTLS
jgi:hypothetical protein